MDSVSFPTLISHGCGIGIYKKVVVATIDGSGLRKETREFNAFMSFLIELRDWLLTNGITHVPMESIGIYWKPVTRF